MVMVMVLVLFCGEILHRFAWPDLQYRDVLRWVGEMLWNASREPRGRESLVVTAYEWLRVQMLPTGWPRKKPKNPHREKAKRSENMTDQQDRNSWQAGEDRGNKSTTQKEGHSAKGKIKVWPAMAKKSTQIGTLPYLISPMPYRSLF